MTGGQEEYYLHLSREDYYLAGGEPPGMWIGRGAQALGLTGKVERDALSGVLAGRGPAGIRLGQAQVYSDGRARQPGWDLTFSAPKSVSVLWSQSDGQVRATIQDAQAHAVRESLKYLEDVAAITRRGKGGETVEQAGLLIATFEHGTSRAQDPQLHTHVLVANAGLRADGSWGALRSRDFYVHKMVAGALYRSELAHQLSNRLGLALVQERSWFELKIVPQALREIFSTRRNEIEAALAEHGWSGAKAAEFLTKTTREVKSHVARDVLFDRWRGVAESLGVRIEGLTRIQPVDGTHAQGTRGLKRQVNEAVKELLSSDSHFTERDLLRRTAERSQAAGYRIQDLREAVSNALTHSKDIVHLGEHRGVQVYTSQELLAVEGRLLGFAEQTKGSKAHVVEPSIVEQVLAERPTIKPEQRDALRYLTLGQGSLQCVTGMAGTGKTYLLDAAREAWERQGFTVVGCALASRAALQLEKDANIKSSTIARFLGEKHPDVAPSKNNEAGAQQTVKRPKSKSKGPKLTDKTIVVVDEAGMVGTRQLDRIRAKAEAAGAKVVCVGDGRQLSAIDEGGGFDALSRKVGGPELKEITRQHEPWMQEAVHQFADGDARGALSQYALAERLHVEPTRTHAIDRLIEHWQEQRTRDLSQTIILAGTNEAVDMLNNRAQAARVRRGELEESSSVRLGDARLCEGDRVLFTKNEYARGILNGDFGTVEMLHEGRRGKSPRAVVRLDRAQRYFDAAKGEWKERTSMRVTVAVTDEANVRLGYAITVHKAQGATFERGFVLSGSWMNDRELTYVQMSRSRGTTRIYAADSDVGEDLSELARTMSQSHAKELARDIQEQHQREKRSMRMI